jgi:hypothetical protein
MPAILPGAGCRVPVSPWWWLVPPALYWLQRRRGKQYRTAAMAGLTAEQRVVLVDYINKATGWLFVGLGGFLIAVKETWEVCELYEWPTWAFIGLAVLAAGLGLLATAARMQQSRKALAVPDLAA